MNQLRVELAVHAERWHACFVFRSDDGQPGTYTPKQILNHVVPKSASGKSPLISSKLDNFRVADKD